MKASQPSSISHDHEYDEEHLGASLHFARSSSSWFLYPSKTNLCLWYIVDEEYSSYGNVPVVPGHIYSINDSLSAEEAASEYEFVLRQLVKTRTVDVSEISDCPKFDLILLGMGPDGHVASLFPNHIALDEKEEWIIFITDSPKPPPERITFTLPVINSASNVAVVVTGANKAEAVHLAIDNVGSECPVLPARMVCPTNGKLVWFLDRAAASMLEASQ
ncbi:hypothetical protein NE237_020844 [Protea cynaroides]|uniref:Probable 6-phosphogluconolactonase n=1 Tax=Protea cynaroides TaxID=273540 RepID=A0A9Q0K219_9MAGN|nr:hypothetical protein NE237_020844 [Protea cynaroides]